MIEVAPLEIKAKNVKPLNDLTLVKVDDVPEMEDGIYVCYNRDVHSAETWEPTYGDVVSVSRTEDAPKVKVGDRVAFDPWRGTMWVHDKIEYRFLEPEEVLAVLEE